MSALNDSTEASALKSALRKPRKALWDSGDNSTGSQGAASRGSKALSQGKKEGCRTGFNAASSEPSSACHVSKTIWLRLQGDCPSKLTRHSLVHRAAGPETSHVPTDIVGRNFHCHCHCHCHWPNKRMEGDCDEIEAVLTCDGPERSKPEPSHDAGSPQMESPEQLVKKAGK